MKLTLLLLAASLTLAACIFVPDHRGDARYDCDRDGHCLRR